MTTRDSNSGPVIFCDFDGTVTQEDVTDRILEELAAPAWREVEDQWVRGRIGSRECLERQMALVDASREQLDAVVDAVPLDPGFVSFYQFTRARRIPFYVVSDGFDYVIRHTLRRSGVDGPLENGSHLFSSALRVEGHRLTASFPEPACAHGCATCKARIVERVRGRHHPVIFIGDGLSDRFGTQAADIVFAKKHLLAYCRNHQQPCHAFETFTEIERELRSLAPSRLDKKEPASHRGAKPFRAAP